MKTVSAGNMIGTFLFVAMATMLASSPAGAAPLTNCDFFTACSKWVIPTLNICPGGDKAYTQCNGRIKHNVKTDTATVDIATQNVNSQWCGMSASENGPWNTIKCANKFTTIQQWVHKRNLQDDAPWFLNKYIKIQISAAQYQGGWGNYNSKGNPRDCVMIKTSSFFANPNGTPCSQ
ncbi:hypothetical protein CBR_g12848 [Chara braunii]|uniref:Expansin-like EG45 domain-containing protein n=1 Tax=Chara braunii TaxID=69332 RepID=A0A388KST5_CHABU|nr:hypothetical protein CBR_g12848 [Chara braunii]|eukprot:GBG73131.1 hypothetical protein CBR_g12848 [Chara braunii]